MKDFAFVKIFFFIDTVKIHAGKQMGHEEKVPQMIFYSLSSITSGL